MFGIPIWAIQLIIVVLRQLGFINLAENLLLRLGTNIVKVAEKIAKDIKTYNEYPKQKSNFSDSELLPNITNINRKT